MYKAIKLHNAKGETIEVGFLANAATPLRYKMVFHNDLITMFANSKKETDEGVKYNIDFLPELSFIMAMQSKAADDDKIKLDKHDGKGRREPFKVCAQVYRKGNTGVDRQAVYKQY